MSKYSNWENIRRLLSYSRRYTRRIIIAMLASFGVAATDVAFAKLVQPFVDRLLVTDTAGGPRAAEGATGRRNTVPEDTLGLDESDIEDGLSDDILETEEEGLVFVPPTRPVPER